MRKAISLFLVFSILALSGNMFAQGRKGADLIIRKTDGTLERGELIAVKQNSLLLLDRESGADVTVDIGDIRVITILKKSKALSGAGLGFLVGVGPGAIIGYRVGWRTSEGAVWGAVVGGLATALIGGYIGLSLGKEVTIQIEGMSDLEIQEILEKLRKQARVRNSQ